MREALVVQVLERKHRVCDVEPRRVLRHAPVRHARQERKQVAVAAGVPSVFVIPLYRQWLGWRQVAFDGRERRRRQEE